MIVADTGAVIALIDADDDHHEAMQAIYDRGNEPWILPWAILPEVDYLLGAHVSTRAQAAFIKDLAAGLFAIEWGQFVDIARVYELKQRYRSLHLGLVDAAVMAVAERKRARAIATVDTRHFAAVEIKGSPALLPRDA